jgi:integrase
MRWPNVDLAGRVWTVPRTKSGVEHRVPLPDAAIAVLRRVKELGLRGEFVFPSPDRPGQSLSNGAMLAVLERMCHGDLTAHGFRATFKTWASERTNFARDVIEGALAHAVGNKVEAAYQRGDLIEKRRRLMDAWAQFISTPAVASTVVALRG